MQEKLPAATYLEELPVADSVYINNMRESDKKLQERKYMDYRRIPKIELHCHLDGSMGLDVMQRLLDENGTQMSETELRKKIEAPDDCQSLAEYLDKFALPIELLQTGHGLEETAYNLAKTAAAENVKYIEVRFAPAFHRSKGLKIQDEIESVQKGLLRAQNEFGIYSGILVCAMRHLDMDANISMLRSARELYGAGVVGCDIAGDEKPHTNMEYKAYFDEAGKLGLPFTIHSGECGNADNVAEAVELGAKRVGHGIAMHRRPDIIRLCSDKRIGVEMCPVSNIQTKAVSDFNTYPFEVFYKAGIPVSINTDNRTVSSTSCAKEWETLSQIYDFSEDDVERIYRDSVEVSFTSDDIKDKLLRKVKN